MRDTCDFLATVSDIPCRLTELNYPMPSQSFIFKHLLFLQRRCSSLHSATRRFISPHLKPASDSFIGACLIGSPIFRGGVYINRLPDLSPLQVNQTTHNHLALLIRRSHVDSSCLHRPPRRDGMVSQRSTYRSHRYSPYCQWREAREGNRQGSCRQRPTHCTEENCTHVSRLMESGLLSLCLHGEDNVSFGISK